MRDEFSISNVVHRSWELYKNHLGNLILFLFLITLISFTFGALRFFTPENSWIIYIVSFVETFVNVLMGIGFIRILINIAEEKEYSLSTLFNQANPKLILHFIVGALISIVAIFAGLLLLIIPGIYLALRLQFLVYILLKQSKPDFYRALKISWKLTEGKVWQLAGLSFLSLGLLILGLLAFIIGAIFIAPLVELFSVVAFTLIHSNLPSPSSRPSEG